MRKNSKDLTSSPKLISPVDSHSSKKHKSPSTASPLEVPGLMDTLPDPQYITPEGENLPTLIPPRIFKWIFTCKKRRIKATSGNKKVSGSAVQRSGSQ